MSSTEPLRPVYAAEEGAAAVGRQYEEHARREAAIARTMNSESGHRRGSDRPVAVEPVADGRRHGAEL
eukprot:11178614-Lingulodinium_polyedra.AAC.1